jgi:hypothetical protein
MSLNYVAGAKGNARIQCVVCRYYLGEVPMRFFSSLLIVEHDADEGAVDVHTAAVVVDKAQVPEAI